MAKELFCNLSVAEHELRQVNPPGVYKHFKGGFYRLLFVAHGTEIGHEKVEVFMCRPSGDLVVVPPKAIWKGERRTFLFHARNITDDLELETGPFCIYTPMTSGPVKGNPGEIYIRHEREWSDMIDSVAMKKVIVGQSDPSNWVRRFKVVSA